MIGTVGPARGVTSSLEADRHAGPKDHVLVAAWAAQPLCSPFDPHSFAVVGSKETNDFADVISVSQTMAARGFVA